MENTQIEEKPKSTTDKVLDNLFDLKVNVNVFAKTLEQMRSETTSTTMFSVLDVIIKDTSYIAMKEAANVDLTK